MSTPTTAHLTSHHLEVPGGRLYYEVRGAGPLLLVVGQPMTSGAFGPLADLLAQNHTVVTYDPHGLGQSTVDDPGQPVTPDIGADDLALLLEAVDRGPADVFGTSGGAVTGLALVARHPERVRTLIAHEPPVAELLPDAAHVRTAVDGIEDGYRAGGSGAGWGAFVSLVIHQGPVTEAGVAPAGWPPPGPHAPADDAPAAEAAEPAPPSAKQQADDELFFLRILKPLTRYQPAVDLLRSGQPRVVVAVGATSTGELAVRSATALSERLGAPPAVLPGDHAGFLGDPAGFAAELERLLA